MRRDIARIVHHKTRKLVDIPLYDEDGTVLWPELMVRLDASPRYGTLIVMRDRLDRRRKSSPAMEAGLFPPPRCRHPRIRRNLISASSSWDCATEAIRKAATLI